MKLELVRPDVRYKNSFLQGLQSLPDSEKGAWIYLGGVADIDSVALDFEAYVQTLLARETTALAGFVTDTIYWGKIGDEIIGRISMRHELTESLRKVGGHIGYIVWPAWRSQGMATELLRQVLQTPRAAAYKELLLTCDENNVASEKTILKNGGVLEDILELAPGAPKKKRFWIRRGI